MSGEKVKIFWSAVAVRGRTLSAPLVRVSLRQLRAGVPSGVNLFVHPSRPKSADNAEGSKHLRVALASIKRRRSKTNRF
ncbi:hypothetical protein EVAR_61439_1 [Eumeta japonica]|uniref:Uncharacterized protein n=1 Tax=Eumeta variegata TaxID=151549 RepID=A0A4C1Y6H6_EUMVA|nr:hypothetical protein EVAR_61439_1 [Eumeta japonica]